MTRYLYQFQIYLTPAWWFALRNPIPVQDAEDPETCANARFQILRGFPPALDPQADEPVTPIQDPAANYRFLRKHHHWAWAWYVFFLRLASFKAGPKEWFAFWRTAKVKRQPKEIAPLEQLQPLADFRPKVSVVIASLNRYAYLQNVLQDLAQQTVQPYEVWVVDQSDPHQADFFTAFDLPLKVVHQHEPALWLARNTAIQRAQGEYIALLDDDVRLKPDWLEQHLRCIQHFQADISVGSFYPSDRPQEKTQARFRLSEQFNTNNTLLNRRVFKRIGLFDRQFEGQRMGDYEFGVRAHLAGSLNIFNPLSAVADIKAPTGGLRAMGNWDASRSSGLFAPIPVPSTLYLMRRHFGTQPAFWFMVRALSQRLVPYRFKRNRLATLLFAPLSILFLPMTVFKGMRAWSQASQKLAQGPRIGSLEGNDDV